jgi:prepilin-type N-terminal cleavage/methylation domain-containing protein
MKGGKNRQPLGYTIVEVMIVLAVSGVMFVIAASFINGKQARTAFTASVNQVASTVQNVLEQVTDGQYSDIPFTCTTGSPPTFNGAPVSNQGANSPCVFLGKLFYFEQGTQPDYDILSLAGNRLNSAGTPAVSFTDTYPTPVHGGSVNLTIQTKIPQNLHVANIKVNGATAFDFGFSQGLGSLNTTDATNNTFASGAQAVNLIYTTAPSGTGLSLPSLLNDLSAGSAASTYATAKTASICLTDGTRYATIDVGQTNGNQLSVNVTMQGSAASC